MRQAEDLALHGALAIGDNRAESWCALLTMAPDPCPPEHKRRWAALAGENSGKELQPQCLGGGTRGFGSSGGIRNQVFAAPIFS